MKKLTLIILVIILLSACAPKPRTLTPSIELSTITSQPPTPTKDVVLTYAPEGNDSRCEEIRQSDLDLIGSGYLLLWRNTPEYILTNMDSKETKKIPNIWSVFASPNKSAIAYLNSYLDPKLVIVDEGGIKEYTLPNVTPTITWINDHTIRLYENLDNLDTYALLLDINTGEIARLETNFPDFYMYPDEVNRYWSIPAFDSALTYAVYPSYIYDTEYLGNTLIRLNDKKILGLFSTDIRVAPVWSPSGESFLLPYSNNDVIELYRIFAEDQDVIALTNFHSTSPNFLLNSYVWSPDGSKIAAWFLEDHESSLYKSLILIDLSNNNRVILTCIQSTQSIGDLQDKIIWSPDSSQLIAQVKIDADSKVKLVLLDIPRLEYDLLDTKESSFPVGWLSFEPVIP